MISLYRYSVFQERNIAWMEGGYSTEAVPALTNKPLVTCLDTARKASRYFPLAQCYNWGLRYRRPKNGHNKYKSTILLREKKQ